jgi:hypothetical protein
VDYKPLSVLRTHVSTRDYWSWPCVVVFLDHFCRVDSKPYLSWIDLPRKAQRESLHPSAGTDSHEYSTLLPHAACHGAPIHGDRVNIEQPVAVILRSDSSAGGGQSKLAGMPSIQNSSELFTRLAIIHFRDSVQVTDAV